MTDPIPAAPRPWRLARVLMPILAAAFAGLMLDLRVEHADVVRHTRLAWLPIGYCAVMAVACALAAASWNPTARLLVRILFLAGFIVSGLGFYLHNHGKLVLVLTSSLHAWTDATMPHPHGPPQTAPLAIAGLGLLGAVATLKRFNFSPPRGGSSRS